MPKINVERVGGIAGFGGPQSRVRSIGEVETESLSKADQRIIDKAFRAPSSDENKDVRDGFRYRLSRSSAKGVEEVEVAESRVPASVTRCVRDVLE